MLLYLVCTLGMLFINAAVSFLSLPGFSSEYSVIVPVGLLRLACLRHPFRRPLQHLHRAPQNVSDA